MTKESSMTAAIAKPPDVASASVRDALAALHVNHDSGLTHAEVDVLLWSRRRVGAASATEAPHRSGGDQGGPLALRHRRRAAGRGDRAVSDPRRAAPGDGSAHARSVDERGAGGSTRWRHVPYRCQSLPETWIPTGLRITVLSVSPNVPPTTLLSHGNTANGKGEPPHPR